MLDRRKLLKLAASASALTTTAGFRRPTTAKPNFIHICADDARFDDVEVMPNLDALLRRKGVSFENHNCSFALCAPSRVSMLTGLTAHNHGVLLDKQPGGYSAYADMEDNALPVWLSASGYQVSHIGKFINGYELSDPFHIPPGYADWHVIASEQSNYVDFTLSENGHVNDYFGSYTTDVFFQKLLDFIAGAQEPYAAFLWPNSVHWPAVPAAQDLGTFDKVKMRKRPDFNEEDVSDKPRYVRRRKLLDKRAIRHAQKRWRRRAECLQSFDRGIAALMSALTANGQIARTHILFTSDNGITDGEHRLPGEKNLLYEETARVPLYWVTPEGFAGTRSQPLANIDATAAMIELAGATAGRVLDGTSLVPLLCDPEAEWQSASLMQCGQGFGLCTDDYRYVVWSKTGEIELYDMTIDPYQLDNKAGLSEYAGVQAALAAALDSLRGCAGGTCRWTGSFPPPPK